MTHVPYHLVETLRDCVARFYDAFGRVPTVALDADGVLYEFEGPFIAHHNLSNPELPPVVGPFQKFDVGYGLPEDVQEALQESMRTLDWSTLQPYPEALTGVAALMQAGVDVSVATAHRPDNTYSPSAKVFQLQRDFAGVLDNRVQIGIDKTRTVADWLVDDKPEVTGNLIPLWEHLVFTKNYNRDVTDKVHVTWGNLIEVLIELVNARVEDRKPQVSLGPASVAGGSVVGLGAAELADFAAGQDFAQPTFVDPAPAAAAPTPVPDFGAQAGIPDFGAPTVIPDGSWTPGVEAAAAQPVDTTWNPFGEAAPAAEEFDPTALFGAPAAPAEPFVAPVAAPAPAAAPVDPFAALVGEPETPAAPVIPEAPVVNFDNLFGVSGDTPPAATEEAQPISNISWADLISGGDQK